MKIIETERLVLMQLQESHLDALHQMLLDPIVMQWLFSGKPMEKDEREHLINASFTFGDKLTGLGALIETSTQQFVGFAGLLPCNFVNTKSYELGFALQKNS